MYYVFFFDRHRCIKVLTLYPHIYLSIIKGKTYDFWRSSQVLLNLYTWITLLNLLAKVYCFVLDNGYTSKLIGASISSLIHVSPPTPYT